MTPPANGRSARQAPVWLVDGEDPVLVSDAVSKLVGDLVGSADRELVLQSFAGEEVDLAAVADACRTPPLLTDRRVVVVRDIGRFGTDEVAPVLEYLEAPLATTSLVLAAGGGRVAPKLAAAVKAHGRVVSTQVSGRDAKNWVRERLRASPLSFDPAAVEVVERHLGEDVGRLSALLPVLEAAYGREARLGPDEVTPYLGEAGAVAPWDLSDAIDAGKTQAALEVLHRMLGAGERHPLVVLATLVRQVESALRVDGPEIVSEGQAARALGIPPGRSTFAARKALERAHRWGSEGIAEAVGLMADAEANLKGATDWPEPLVLEVLVARLCRLSRSGRATGAPRRGPSRPARGGSRAAGRTGR